MKIAVGEAYHILHSCPVTLMGEEQRLLDQL